MNKQEEFFIYEVYQALLKYAPSYSIKAYPAVIAQAILESGWNKSTLAKNYYNIFGMKCGSSWKGKSVNLRTMEEYDNTLVTITDNFRVYDSIEECVKGYLDFINTKRYENLKGVVNSEMYVRLIKDDGYATSSTYVKSLLNIINQYNLEKYSYNEVVEKKDNNVYTVVKGDTLWGISLKFYGTGKRYTEIMNYNNLPTTTIYPNQKLIIP